MNVDLLLSQLYRAMNRGDLARAKKIARELDASLGLPKSSKVTIRTQTQLPPGVQDHPSSYVSWVTEVWPRYEQAVRDHDAIEVKAEAARGMRSQSGIYLCERCGREVFCPPGKPNKKYNDKQLTQGHRCGRRVLPIGAIQN